MSTAAPGSVQAKLALSDADFAEYQKHWAAVDTSGGLLRAKVAAVYFETSKLPKKALQVVWKRSDTVPPKGKLNESEFFTALKLIALTQAGTLPGSADLSASTPLPKVGASAATELSPEAVDTGVKAVLRAEKIKLWLPPYTAAVGGGNTMPTSTVAAIAKRVGAGHQIVSSTLERLRVKSIARKTPDVVRKAMPKPAGAAATTAATRSAAPSAADEVVAPLGSVPMRAKKPTNPFDRKSLVGSDTDTDV